MNKTCNKCNLEKDIINFTNNRNICNECRKKYQKEYCKNNKEKIRQAYTVYYKNNKILIDRVNITYNKNHKEHRLFYSAKQRSIKHNLIFNITKQDIKYLLDITPICPLRKVSFDLNNYLFTDNSVTLDRIDPLKGYTKDNIQILSYKANAIKNNINLNTFKKIVNNFKNYSCEEHSIDDITRKIIIRDRKNQISNSFSYEKNRRILNIEKSLFDRAKYRAKQKNIIFNIDEEYLKSIWSLDNKCPILKKKICSG